MPLPSFSFNHFPDRKNPTPTQPTLAADDLAAEKAAAWAWYHHGSGSESKPMREFGLTRPVSVPKPSRYRLEAIRIAQTFFQDNSQTPCLHNSLLDSYEVASISRRISDLLDPTDRNNFSLRSFESEILDLGREIERKSTKPKKFGAFWRRRSVMCGKIEDVAIGSLVRSPGKQQQRPT
ncbi:uncharacterized protein LOC111460520 [Cucurbita moschata]|uniref:Uncharacterized protein LOC111460520 n=1 Tax=Cucurbita moschata TaxID=3662 RepID=A0A6J1H668_CUCMO|nr:uncharacterized protein LOC111460520 [Cucurbita moschata]